MSRLSPWLVAALSAGYLFLYAPILILVIYSFNASKLVTVWGGWSARWYGELARNDQLLEAAALSVQIAAASATVAALTLRNFLLLSLFDALHCRL